MFTVDDKKGFYTLYETGIVNRPEQWALPEEIKKKGGTFSIRNRSQTSIQQGFKTIYNISFEKVVQVFAELPGVQQRNLIIMRDPPRGRVIQGEYTFCHQEYLKYTRNQEPLGLAFRNGDYAEALGGSALMLMKSAMDEQTYEDIHRIMEMFHNPGGPVEYPIIEFTVFERCTGILNRNTLIWEVRRY